jgi:hypothetical protein
VLLVCLKRRMTPISVGHVLRKLSPTSCPGGKISCLTVFGLGGNEAFVSCSGRAMQETWNLGFRVLGLIGVQVAPCRKHGTWENPKP